MRSNLVGLDMTETTETTENRQGKGIDEVLHEMMHIPALGDKLIDHDVKDFRALLGVDLDWHEPGADVPNVLEG